MPETVNELGAQMLALINERREECATTARDDSLNTEARERANAAGRDFSLAVTHLEDSLTRYNSGCYRRRGTWMRADPDKS